MAKWLKIAAVFVDFVKMALILTKTCLQTPTIVIKYNYNAHMWPVNRTGKNGSGISGLFRAVLPCAFEPFFPLRFTPPMLKKQEEINHG